MTPAQVDRVMRDVARRPKDRCFGCQLKMLLVRVALFFGARRVYRLPIRFHIDCV